MVHAPNIDAVKFLVARKYPERPTVLARLPPNSSLSRTSVSHSPLSRAEVDRRRVEAEKYAVELCHMPPDELQALFETEAKKHLEEVEARKQAEENARFYNQVSANADFNHWSRAAHWTLEEAVALSFGKNPEIVNWKAIEPWQSASSFVIEYARLLDLARRAAMWQQLFDPFLPGIYIGWIRRNEIQFPQALEDAACARGNNVADWKLFYDDMKDQCDELQVKLVKAREESHEITRTMAAQRDEALARLRELENSVPPVSSAENAQDFSTRELSTREKDCLLKMIIGMAVKGYGYDPAAKRSEQVTEIISDLESAGVALDPNTIRKWLRAAAELLPPI